LQGNLGEFRRWGPIRPGGLKHPEDFAFLCV
jgi:hypothetical protein